MKNIDMMDPSYQTNDLWQILMLTLQLDKDWYNIYKIFLEMKIRAT